MNISKLSETFRNFAEIECKGSSPLYERLSIDISADREMLQFASSARRGQPVPNLLFGSVHFLLQKGSESPLREYFGSLTENPRTPDGQAFHHFKQFCMKNEGDVRTILQTKLVQTNEVRRCSYLFPIFCYIQSLIDQPLALIEIGTSAGFQLLFDQYKYSYDCGETYGNPSSNVMITSEIKGEGRPILGMSTPQVASRIGVDLRVNDFSSDEDELWLESLIWPEHQERRKLFKQAAKIVQEHELKLIEGNGVELLLEISREVPKDEALCVFHTHVANQMSLKSKIGLLETVSEIGKERDIFHIYNNIQDRNLHLDSYISGKEVARTIGKTDGHGRWFTWEGLPSIKNR
ncbi:DUF2332 domain-containing protein [Mesobacillus zeae]|uniref:DUF2332 domain-containing protein n=1 Tax=Mesobacillus zeae TaxID=1917180 RepID=UPI003008FB8D